MDPRGSARLFYERLLQVPGWETMAPLQPAITDPAHVQPGDMLLFTNNGHPGGIHHVGLYLGAGQMLHAPQTGDVVKTEPDIWNNSYYAREFIGAVRATHHPAT
ncbi:C40 family peptidase [Pseudonocardia sp. ICBG601]|uniref:C40 family peptidase n=1 Tax=Pseudonocardia sp. ICBG601 TaxID=2846759 RepID=UPI001CF6B5C1|nr:NlpC/P60 family protein [Pseudonocardia sp. ICBG601]